MTTLSVTGQILHPTPAFRSYWSLSAERQRMFFRRLRGERPPWADDPVLATNRFTNAYRALDRVSQYFINEVIYGASTDERSTVLRVLVFKIFNRVDTWRYLEDAVGRITVDTFNAVYLSKLLDSRMAAGERLYSAAYIMPSPKLGETRKHWNHLRLLDELLVNGTVDRLLEASSLRELYEILLHVHSFGPFLAFQFAIDLNYSPAPVTTPASQPLTARRAWLITHLDALPQCEVGRDRQRAWPYVGQGWVRTPK